jgi:hypothetical protein
MNLLTQRFFAAARICGGDSTIKQRLADAWMLHLDDISPGDLPPSERQKFVTLREGMYERTPLPKESAPQASIRKMSVQQAASYTDLIITIYGQLVRAQSSSTLVGVEIDSNVGSSVVTSLEDRMLQHLN